MPVEQRRTRVSEGVCNELIHAPKRLKICALLASVTEAEFRVLGDELVLSDSDLSKQLKLLESAGYVAARKTTVDKYRKTWLSLSSAGRVAFDSHARALNELVVGSSKD